MASNPRATRLATRRLVKRERLIVGWAEHVAFPDWGIRRLRAKVDSGARTSALHVENITTTSDGRARFNVLLDRDSGGASVRASAKISREGTIRPSDGIAQRRLIVEARIIVGGLERIIEVGLVGRDDMSFRMLLGRTTFGRDFLVDASRRYMLDPEPLSVLMPRRNRKRATKR